jgi:hypothetical protein
MVLLNFTFVVRLTLFTPSLRDHTVESGYCSEKQAINLLDRELLYSVDRRFVVLAKLRLA